MKTNLTDILNKTEDFDPFCVQLITGPLVMLFVSVPCVCVGLPASVWLMWVLIQRQRSGLSNDVYMFNLTVMDLIYNVFKLPNIPNYFVWRDDVVMTLTILLEGFSINGRPLIMAFICVDCYMAVLSPILYMKVKQTRYRLVVSALVWFFTFAYHLMGALWKEMLHLPIWGVPRILAVSTTIFCDFCILHALRKPDPSGRSGVHPQKRRALQTITNSLIMTIVSYMFPLVIYAASALLPFKYQVMYCNVFIPALICNALGSTIMPLLCLGNLGKLKRISMGLCAESA